jgi:hypothetical protein
MLLGFESQICVQNAPNEIPDLEQSQIAKYHKQDRGDALANRNTKPNRNGTDQQHRWCKNEHPKAQSESSAHGGKQKDQGNHRTYSVLNARTFALNVAAFSKRSHLYV